MISQSTIYTMRMKPGL